VSVRAARALVSASELKAAFLAVSLGVAEVPQGDMRACIMLARYPVIDKGG
jgi:hypothetical protein